MKKTILFIIFLNFFLPVFSLKLPDLLNGVWDGKDRYVFFETDEKTDEIVICLKEYYGWWIDRTAEPEKYKKNPERKINSGTTKDAVQLNISVNKILLQTEDVFCCELKIQYSSSQINYIPICIYEDNLYLNFYIQSKDKPNVYVGNAVSKGLLVSEQIIPENIGCLYVLNNEIYDVRYWKSDMDYSSDFAVYNQNDISFEVPKHIFSANQNYSCVNGRSKKIRNPQSSIVFKDEKLKFSADKSVLIFDENPYLTKLSDRNTYEELMDLINQNNSRRKPEPAALFPHRSISWYLEVIDEIEFNTEYIKKIRAKFDTRNRGK